MHFLQMEVTCLSMTSSVKLLLMLPSHLEEEDITDRGTIPEKIGSKGPFMTSLRDVIYEWSQSFIDILGYRDNAKSIEVKWLVRELKLIVLHI